MEQPLPHPGFSTRATHGLLHARAVNNKRKTVTKRVELDQYVL